MSRIFKNMKERRIYAKTRKGIMIWQEKGWEPINDFPTTGYYELSEKEYPVLYEGLERALKA